MLCEHCKAEMDAKTTRRRFCSTKCRAAAWQVNRADDLAVVEDQLARALTRVRALRGAANARGGGS